MTFCVALKCNEGLVALADTQIVRGHEQLKKTKLSVIEHQGHSFFVMTSGLRSVRDKMILYSDAELKSGAANCGRLFEAANLLGRQLQIIKKEDGSALAASNLSFNIHTIIGGRLRDDKAPTIFFIYPEGNWLEVNADSPYFMIGRSSYGKPILDSLMQKSLPLDQVAALAVLAFDATQTSVTDVDYPIDMLTIHEKNSSIVQHRYGRHDLTDTTKWWREQQHTSLGRLPMQWAQPLGVK